MFLAVGCVGARSGITKLEKVLVFLIITNTCWGLERLESILGRVEKLDYMSIFGFILQIRFG